MLWAIEEKDPIFYSYQASKNTYKLSKNFFQENESGPTR